MDLRPARTQVDLRQGARCHGCGREKREIRLPCGHKPCKKCAFSNKRCQKCGYLRHHQCDYRDLHSSSDPMTSEPRSGSTQNSETSAVTWHQRPRETAGNPWSQTSTDQLENRFASLMRRMYELPSDIRHWRFQRSGEFVTAKVWIVKRKPPLLGFGVLYFNTFFGSGFLLLLLITSKVYTFFSRVYSKDKYL